jgi:hypothetical protein
MRRKLTEKFVTNVEPPKRGRLEINDALEPGLVLRVTENDARSWAARVWTGPDSARRQRRVLLGHPRAIDGQPVLSLAQAREGARSVKQAAAEGRAVVPGDGLKGAQTWGELCEEYITWAADNRRPSTAAEIKRILNSRDLAEWRDRPAASISADDARRLRDAINARDCPDNGNQGRAHHQRPGELGDRRGPASGFASQGHPHVQADGARPRVDR